MATPVVSGVAALIWSAHPSWTRDQVVATLLGTADAADFYANNPGFDDQLGTGRVNAYRGVTEVLPAPRFGNTYGLPPEGRTAGFVNTFTVLSPYRFDPTVVDAGDPNSSPVNPAAFELRGAGADGAFGSADDVLVPLTINGGLPYRIGSNGFTFTFPSLAPGQYRFTAVAARLSDPFGQKLDGNGDGTGGDDFVRTFSAAPTLSGAVYEDFNGSGTADAADGAAGGMTVYLDANGNGKRDLSELYTFSGLGGRFTFPNAQFPTLPAGSYTLRAEVPAGWGGTGGTAGYPVTIAAGAAATAGLNFGMARTGALYGSLFDDGDGNGKRSDAEGGLAGFTVFLDNNGGRQVHPADQVGHDPGREHGRGDHPGQRVGQCPDRHHVRYREGHQRPIDRDGRLLARHGYAAGSRVPAQPDPHPGRAGRHPGAARRIPRQRPVDG